MSRILKFVVFFIASQCLIPVGSQPMRRGFLGSIIHHDYFGDIKKIFKPIESHKDLTIKSSTESFTKHYTTHPPYPEIEKNIDPNKGKTDITKSHDEQGKSERNIGTTIDYNKVVFIDNEETVIGATEHVLTDQDTNQLSDADCSTDIDLDCDEQRRLFGEIFTTTDYPTTTDDLGRIHPPGPVIASLLG